MLSSQLIRQKRGLINGSRHIARTISIAACLAMVMVQYANTQDLHGVDAAQAEMRLRPDAPLFVNENSRIVVMQYEAWFGPNAVTFQGQTAAMPLLQSEDMQAVGGGYDSADPRIIKQHLRWMEEMGVDAAIAEVTNDVSCIFNSEWFVNKYLKNSSCSPWRTDYQNIRNNTGNLYPAWSAARTHLKLIPMLGGVDEDVLYLDNDGKTAFEKEIEYFSALMARYPGRQVIYQGKPLMLIFVGAAQDPSIADNPLWYQIRTFLKDHPGIAEQYTFKYVAGYLDSQPYLWKDQNTASGPVQIALEYGFWSWVDRLNTTCKTADCPFYPSYNLAGRRVENFTVSISTKGENSWGCPDPDSLPYCPDDALRYGKSKSYATFHAFMNYARELDPIFLFVHQFNEFVTPDEGFDTNTDDDIEPANLWGYGGLQAVKKEIERYRRHQRFDDADDPNDLAPPGVN